jgi:hypothetical protein
MNLCIEAIHTVIGREGGIAKTAIYNEKSVWCLVRMKKAEDQKKLIDARVLINVKSK